MQGRDSGNAAKLDGFAGLRFIAIAAALGGKNDGFLLHGQRAGVATIAGGVDAGFDKGRTEGQRLFFGLRPHVLTLDGWRQVVARWRSLRDQPRRALSPALWPDR